MGGSEWLFSAVPYNKFEGKALDTTKFEIYASPNNEKNLLLAFAPNAKSLPYYMLNGIKFQGITSRNDLSGVTLLFPESPSKTTISFSEYFTDSIVTTAAAKPVETKTDTSGLTVGFVLLLITMITLIILGAVILVDYFNTGSFGFFKIFKRMFTAEEQVKSLGKGAKLDSEEWAVGVMDHSADIGREGINNELSRF